MKKRSVIIFIVFSIFILSQSECQKNKEITGKEVIARIGSSVITRDMLNRELAGIQKMDPSFVINKETKMKQLQLIIDRMVLINEAKKEKLDTKEQFIRAIQKYWEQTLIKDLYDEIRKRIEPTIVVSEEEIKNLYKLKKFRITAKIGVFFTKKEAQLNLTSKKSVLKWNEYFDINTSSLPMKLKLHLITLNEGEFSDPIEVNNKYYVCYVIKKVENNIPPLEKVKDDLRSEYKGYKLEREIQKWINGIRERTKVKIYKDKL